MSADPRKEGLLQEIRQKPDDIDLRLIYADLLEDMGQEVLSQYVRLSCKQLMTDHIPGCDFAGNNLSCPNCQLKCRRGGLATRLVEFPSLHMADCRITEGSDELFQCYHHLGLIDSVHARWDKWFDYADILLENHPVKYTRIYEWMSIPIHYSRFDLSWYVVHDKAKKIYGDYGTGVFWANREWMDLTMDERQKLILKLFSNQWPEVEFAFD